MLLGDTSADIPISLFAVAYSRNWGAGRQEEEL